MSIIGMSVMETPTISKTDLSEIVAEGVGMIFQEGGEAFAKYLEFRARFYRYSLNNKILIWLQRPTATSVGSATFWAALNRKPKANATPIYIWSKPFFVDESEKVNGKWVKTGSGKRFRQFRIEHVFDVTDTDVIEGKDDKWQDGSDAAGFSIGAVEGDSHEIYFDRLVTWLQDKEGVPVTVRDIGTDSGGYYDPTSKSIVINDNPGCSFSNSPNARLATLIHEAVHHVGQTSYKKHGRDEAEVLTETAAFMTCYTMGLDTSARSLAYIAQWAFQSSGETIKKMKAYLSEIEGWCWKIENAMMMEPKKEVAE